MATHHPSPPAGMNLHHGPPSGPPPPGMAPQQQQWPAAQQQMAAMNEAVWLQIGEPRPVQVKEASLTQPHREPCRASGKLGRSYGFL